MLYYIIWMGNGMRAFRSHLKGCAWLALMALGLQLVFSFGHIHKQDLVPAQYEHGPAAVPQLVGSSAPEPDGPAGPTYYDIFCTICATISLAGSLLLPAPSPTVALGAVVRQTRWLPGRIAVLVPNVGRLQYEARAPPA
jgi:hypothetical protein